MQRQHPRLKLRVTPAAEKAIRGSHPWVFAASIRKQSRAGDLGELAVIYDRHDKFLAAGLYDSQSPLRVRVLLSGQPQTLAQHWWQQRLEQALTRRAGLFDEQTTGYRWINGESDGWPGLVLDRYDTSLVVKIYSAAWLPRLAEVSSLFVERLQPARLVLRLSRNIQTVAAHRFGLADGIILAGHENPVNPVFRETGIQFEADIYRGQKTGFFLDQRENRRRVQSLAAGLTVLNTFSFSGGFSLYAAGGGAPSVTDVDISPHALAGSKRNFALNAYQPSVAGCQHELIQADAFEWLAANPARKFDLVILDPPALAKRKSERAAAIQAYFKLVTNGIRKLRKDGVLVSASCSAHVTAEEFFTAVHAAAGRSGRAFTELGITGHPADHPATFPEANYLKCIYLRF
jgi:23S rRNA (cytosine1962-C5)-methyltransferase